MSEIQNLKKHKQTTNAELKALDGGVRNHRDTFEKLNKTMHLQQLELKALDGSVRHHRDTFEKLNEKMHLQQLEILETADEHSEKISSLEDKVLELQNAVKVHAEILDDHHEQLEDENCAQSATSIECQLVPNVKSMDPRRRFTVHVARPSTSLLGGRLDESNLSTPVATGGSGTYTHTHTHTHTHTP